jgi:hypothetical protein
VKKSCFAFLLLLASFAEAKLHIPGSLSQSDRGTVLQILGLGSSYKQLDDPFPLGGYSGIEFGVVTEILSTLDIGNLGAKAPAQDETSYYLINVSKGLFNNIDVAAQFAPPGQKEELTYFGGQARWGFYQAEYLPVNMSLSVHATTMNLQNLVITSTQGLDLVTGFSMNDLTLYVGTGFLKSQGTFIAGTGGVVDCPAAATFCEPVVENQTSSHVFAGITFKFSKTFLALQLDRFTLPTYSAKLGMRF